MAVMASAFEPHWGEAWTRPQVESALSSGYCAYFLIGPEGGAPDPGAAVAGFALVRSLFDEAELLLFAIDAAWQRQGLGRRLLEDVLAQARSAGIRRMLLEVRAGNKAEQLYRTLGFAPIGRRAGYYRAQNGERLDAITLSCTVSERE
ncbi:MAG TPA: GNAT family N-acetyltransferase [Novosphingobium sp.]|nr:GNAT family N-acetyltransferase [Novosphingobium sp.]